jgi:trimeric autotransporter adhesin
MRKFILLCLVCFISATSFAQVATTVFATGAASSFKTGNATSSVRTDGAIISTGSTQAGYAVFDLSSIPSGATITSVVVGYNLVSVSGTGSSCKTYGYSGDLSTVTTASVLLSDMTSGTLVSSDSFGFVGNNTITSSALMGFIGANIGSKVSICFTGGGAATYTFTGETGSAATTGVHAPYLTISYCAPPTSVAAIVGTNPVCAGSNFTISGSGSITGGGTLGYSWVGPNAFTASYGSASINASTAAQGIYTLTATHTCGSYTASASVASSAVTVNPAPGAISGAATICINSSASLIDTSAGGTWSSNNISIASVSTSGTVTSGLLAGTAVISYTLPNGCYKTASLPVNAVFPAPISGASSVCAGSNLTLTDSLTGGTWSSASTAVAMAYSSFVYGVASGSTIISYTKLGCTVTKSITVNPNTTSPILGSAPLCLGSSENLSDSTTGGTWSSSNNAVASVSSTGSVTGLSSGYTTITYTNISGCFKTVGLSVSSVNPAPIAGASTMCAGSRLTLTDSLSGGTWSSSAPTIAAAYSLYVFGQSSGTAIITYNKAGCITTKTITVTPNTAGNIIGNAPLCQGNSLSLTDTAIGGTWTSSNTVIATISPTGTVTGTGAGTSTISYSQPNGCFTTVALSVSSINPAPISGPSSVCAGSNITLSDSLPGGNWSAGSAAIAIAYPSYLHGVSAGITIVTYSRLGCFVTKTITVFSNTVGYISGNVPVCTGHSISLSDTSIGGIWSVSNATIASVSNTGTVNAYTSGSAVITYTHPSGCFRTATVAVNSVNPAAISGTAFICSGSSVIYSDSTAGGSWSSSNASVVGLSGATATGITVGTATLTYNSAGCYATKTVTVYTNPVASVTGITTICTSGTTFLQDSTSGGTWTSSNSAIASVSSTGVVTTGAVAGNAVITYTLPSGCNRTKPVYVSSIIPSPISGTSVTYVGNYSTLTDSVAGGTWTSGTPTILGISGSVIHGIAAGTASVTYNKAGCMVSKTITVNTNTIAPIYGVNNVCLGNTTVLHDSTPGGTWTCNNPAIANVIDSTGVVYSVSTGTAIVTYSLPSGCYRTYPVYINYTVPASISGTATVCAGSVTSFSDATPGGTWSSGNTAIAIASGGSVLGVSAGTAVITYNLGGCSVTKTVTVNANTIGAITGVVPMCTGQSIALSDTTPSGTWTSGAPAIATVSSSGVLSAVMAGTGHVTYTATSGCFKSLPIYVSSSIPAPVTGAGSVCVGSVIALTDTTTGGTWSSSTPSVVAAYGANMSGISPGSATITYNKAGCYVTKTITVFANSTGNITGNAPLCVSHSLTLSDTTSGGTWTSSNNTIATVSTGGTVFAALAGNPVITYMMPSGCFKTAVLAISSINPTPITGNGTVCAGTVITLSDSLSGGAWSSSNTAAATCDSNHVLGVSAGTTNITYSKAGCYVAKIITVNANPLDAIAGTTAICVGQTSTLSDAVSGGTWNSSSIVVASVGVTSGIVTAVSAGTAVVTYGLSTGCYKTIPVTVSNVNPAPISGANSVCSGSGVTFTDTTSGGIWSSANVAVASVSGGIVSGISAGTTTITYNRMGCYSVKALTVVANTLPDILGNTAVCVGSTISLSETASGGTWTSSNTSLATVSGTGIVGAIASGSVNVSYILPSGCLKTVAVNISSVNPTPIYGANTICAGANTTFSDSLNGGIWSSSNTSVATLAGPVIFGAGAGIATITYSKSGCLVTKSLTVNVNTLAPVISSVANACIGYPFTLTDTTAGGTGNWSVNNTAIATIGTTGIVTPAAAGIIIGSYTIGGCVRTTSVAIHVPPTAITGSSDICTSVHDTLHESQTGGYWSSSVPGTAAVNATTGIVTGLSSGSGYISYTITGCPAQIFPISVSFCREGGNLEQFGASDKFNSYTLFPNPTSGSVTLSQSLIKDASVTVSIINTMGQIVYRKEIQIVSGQSSLDMSDLFNGIYTLQITEANGTTTGFRVMKQ